MFFKDFTFSARSLWTSILGRFLLHFRARIRRKSAHRGVRTRPEKRYKKKLHLEGFGVDFAWILEPSLDPGGGSANAVLGIFGALGLSWGEDGPRMRQERFQDRFWTDFGRFFVDFWSIFCCSLPPFLWIWSAISFQKLALCPSILRRFFDNSVAKSLHRGTVAEKARRAAGLSYMIIIICDDYHICWLSYMIIIIYDDYHMWWSSYMIIIYDHHIWLPYMIIVHI